jgi:hypothetical protein
MPEHRSGGWTQRLRSIYSHHYKKLTYIAVCQDIWNLTMNGTRKKKRTASEDAVLRMVYLSTIALVAA